MAEVDRKLEEIDRDLTEIRLSSTGEALDKTKQEELVDLLAHSIKETNVESIMKQVIERASNRIGDTSLDKLSKQFQRSLSRMRAKWSRSAAEEI